MSKLQDLLKRWAELEPERCKFESALYVKIGRHDHLVPNGAYMSGPNGLSIIEYALREAILARGWRYEMASPRIGTPAWCVQLAYASNGQILWADGQHDHPVIALLQAHLQALEGQGNA